MNVRASAKWGKYIGIVLAALAAGSWLAFVPSAKEAPYAFVSAWGGKGSAPGQFDDPTGIAVAGDEVFVSDSRNGRFKRQFGTPGHGMGQLGCPMHLTVHAGELYVVDVYNDRVQAFGADGAFLRKWGGPFAMNICGPFKGWFATATGLAIDKAGNVFVADFYNHRIQKFSPEGVFLTSFGAEGSGAGQFHHAIAWRWPATERCSRSISAITGYKSGGRRELIDEFQKDRVLNLEGARRCGDTWMATAGV